MNGKKRIILNVPYIDQSIHYPTGCESVSSVMLLQYLGIDITVDEFIEKYLEDLSSYSPIISLLFVPIMAFLLKLLYRKKQMKYMAHLAFSFHWGCFFYIALALFCIVGWLWKFDGLPFYLFLAANLLYTTVALHWVYGNGWVKSFLKTAVIYLFYFIAGVFFVGVSLALVYSSFGKDYGLL